MTTPLVNSSSVQCPCDQQRLYAACCQPYHLNHAEAPDALALMRSRYSAYVFKEADYIIKTTHSKNVAYQTDQLVWRREILKRCERCTFNKLEIIEFTKGPKIAFVTFHAHFTEQGKEYILKEKSQFENLQGYWLYLSGTFYN